jgi:hypothetical protein
MQSLQQGRFGRERAWETYREIATRERRALKEKYRQQRRMLAALPVSGRDRQRLSKQLALRQPPCPSEAPCPAVPIRYRTFLTGRTTGHQRLVLTLGV